MRIEYVAAILSFPLYVNCLCSYGGWIGVARTSYHADAQDATGIFSDLSIPRTMSEVEAYWWDGCTQAVTALATVYISGSTFVANPISFSFYNFTATRTPIFVTYHFPKVTLTSLKPGDEVTFVAYPFEYGGSNESKKL